MVQPKNTKQRQARKSETSTPRGVVRKLLKPQRSCKRKSRSSKKKDMHCQDEDMETAASQDAGTPVSGQASKTRTPGGTVSSATKLKLAAFSANDSLVCLRCMILLVPFVAYYMKADNVFRYVFVSVSLDVYRHDT